MEPLRKDCGKPRRTYRRAMDEDMDGNGNLWQKIRKIVQDRAESELFVCGVYPGRGTGNGDDDVYNIYTF